jgi:hypothetical protein
MEHEDRPMLIEVYDGQFFGDMASITKLCVVEGRVTPYDRGPFSTLEEAWRLLEMCTEKYATPAPRGECFTVFITSKSVNDAELELLARLDVHARNGEATACVVTGRPAWNTERVRYQPDDSAVTITLNVLRGNLRAE